jgi:hypothetical protein
VQALAALGPAPSSLEDAKHLRQIATLIGQQEKDASTWLGSDLVPKVLRVLRSYPASHSPAKDALHTCAAALNVLNNLASRLEHPQDPGRFLAMLVGDPAACSALLHWCLCGPEAAQQLPPAHDVTLNMTWDHDSVPRGANAGHPFWTPFTYSMSFFRLLLIQGARSSPTDAMRAQMLLKDAVTPGLLERLLRLVVRHPCSTPRAHGAAVQLVLLGISAASCYVYSTMFGAAWTC